MTRKSPEEFWDTLRQASESMRLLTVNPECSAAEFRPPYAPEHLRTALYDGICPACSKNRCADRRVFIDDGLCQGGAAKLRQCPGCGDELKTTTLRHCRCCDEGYALCPDCIEWAKQPPTWLDRLLARIFPSHPRSVDERQQATCDRLLKKK